MAVDAAAPAPAAAETAEGQTVATVDEARKLAKSTGKPVTVGSMLSERRTVQVNPDGSFTAMEHLRPVRARVGGGWKPVDATLVAVAGGYAPKASTVNLRISGGGDGPLVSMSRAGRTLRFFWPEKLPAPSLDGDKAIYRSVIDGVDLIVKADVDGFSHVLRVTTPEAALDPRLERLTLRMQSRGLTVAEHASGLLTAADAASGGAVFEAPQPIMWDSRGVSGGAVAAEAAEDPVDGPPEGSSVAEVDVEVGSGDLTLLPDLALLRGEETVFPVYVDPQWKTVSRADWAMVSSGYPNTSYFEFKGDEGVGFCDYSWDWTCNRDQIKRVLFTMPMSPYVGKHILSATFTAYNTKSYNCSDDRRVELWRINKFSRTTTWNSHKDNWLRYITHRTVSYCSKAPVEFSGSESASTNVRKEVQSAADAGYGTISFGLRAGSESTMAAWKRFADEAYLRVNFNTAPSKPKQSELESEPGGACTLEPAGVAQLPQMRATLRDPDGDQLYAQFGVGWDHDGDGSVSERWTSADPATNPEKAPGAFPSGSDFTLTIPPEAGVPEDAVAYWKVRSWDGYQYSPWSLAGEQTGCYFIWNTSTPAGPDITSTDYLELDPNDPNAPGYDGVGRYGEFTIDSPSDDVERYWIGLNENPTEAWEVAPAYPGGPVMVKVAPEFAGNNSLRARAINNAGTKSEISTYRFRVNPGTAAKAHWKLDEPQGATEVADVSGTYPAAVNGGVTLGKEGVSGTAMETNGTDAYAKTAGPVLEDTSTSFAVSAWARLTDPKPGTGIIATQAGKQQRSGFELYYSAYFDRWIFNRYDADTSSAAIVRAQSQDAPAAGQWAHLVGVYDSVKAEIRLYVNGELQATTPYDAPWNAAGPVHIGAGWYGSLGSFLHGQIDDVRVYDRIVTGDEARELYLRNPVVAGRWKLDDSPTELPGTEAHYKLDEAAGATRAEDATGTYPAGATDVTFGVDGKHQLAANFNGTTSHLATTGKVLDTTASFSVSAWAKLPATKPDHAGIIATQAGVHKSGFELYYSSYFDKWIFNRYDADVSTGATIVRAQSDTVPGSGWTHLVGAHDVAAQELRLYVDGELQATEPYTAAWSANGRLQVGAGWYDGLGSFFDGDIDDVRVFGEALTGAEAALLAKGSPGAIAADDSEAGHHVALRGNAVIDPSNPWIGSGALALDGDGDSAETAGAVVATNQSFTVAGFVDGVPTADAAIFSQAGLVNSGFTLRYSPDSFNGEGGFQIEMPERDATGAPRKFAEVQWLAPWGYSEHVAIVYDAFRGEMRLYINGQLLEGGTLSNISSFNAMGPLLLGCAKADGALGEYWSGQLDDVWAFHGVLSDEQIGNLANGTELDTYPGP